LDGVEEKSAKRGGRLSSGPSGMPFAENMGEPDQWKLPDISFSLCDFPGWILSGKGIIVSSKNLTSPSEKGSWSGSVRERLRDDDIPHPL